METSDDPAGMVGLFGSALPDLGPLSAGRLFGKVTSKLFDDDKDDDRNRDRHRRGDDSRRTGGTDPDRATRKARRRRRLDASALTRGFGEDNRLGV